MAYKLPQLQARRRSAQFTALRSKLISVAGLIGQEVVNQEGQYLGTVVDLVFRWDTKEPYPPLAGMVVKVSRRHVWVTADSIGHLSATKVELVTATIDLREVRARGGEVRLVREVLDHQLIDVDGARVVRASDLYIANGGKHIRLVGVEVSIRSLLRRLGPRRLRAKPVPSLVIDWATVQSFGGENIRPDLKLSSRRSELHRLRPGELADLLEDLGRDERHELLTVLGADEAADAIEEMEPEEVEAILREAEPEEAGTYLSNMEPDEAADALRDMDEETREELMSHMTKESAKRVERVLKYDEELAGGFMNTTLLIAARSDTVASTRKRLTAQDTEPTELEAIAVVDSSGSLVYDLPIIDLLLASPKAQLEKLIDPNELVTVPLSASIDEAAALLIESRRSSVLVVDEKKQPMGRIFADDVIDALLPKQGSFHFPRLLS